MNRERASLAELERREEFSDRHLGPSPDEQVKMLAELGLASLDRLLDQTVPAAIRLDPDRPLGLPAAMTEPAASARLRAAQARGDTLAAQRLAAWIDRRLDERQSFHYDTEAAR